MYRPTIKESIAVRDDYKEVTCINGVGLKGCRKVINDYLKENTKYKGGWSVYFDYDDGEKYHFILFNDYKKAVDMLSKALGVHDV